MVVGGGISTRNFIFLILLYSFVLENFIEHFLVYMLLVSRLIWLSTKAWARDEATPPNMSPTLTKIHL